jgi:hypothetical protein
LFIGVGFHTKILFMTFLAPRGTQFIGGPPIHFDGGKIKKKVWKPKLFIGVGFHTNILFMTFLAPRGTQFMGDPPIHCEGVKFGKQFENQSCSLG